MSSKHPQPDGTIAIRATILAMLFISGAAGMIYQLLWMRQLGVLFGSTAHAASATLSAFFAGLAAGSWFWGRRTGRISRPLRLYAHLEAGIALTALFYFLILTTFYALYPHMLRAMPGGAPLLAMKFILALLLVFPPSFCMGGTLPAIGQYLIREKGLFGRTSARIYAVNTLGAAAGVTLAAFLLIPKLGFRLSYTVGILLSAAVSAGAWWLSRRCEPAGRAPEAATTAEQTGEVAPAKRIPHRAAPYHRTILVLCFLSGFAMLALEVLWTRMFAQVHENSVYSFAVILAVVLVCLAAGAWISTQLARLRLPVLLTLGVLTTLGGIALTLGPSLFMQATGGLHTLSSLEAWHRYVLRIFSIGFAGIGIVVLILGTLFPFLMKATEKHVVNPGGALGRLLMINTAGAIAGSLLCGFFMLPTYGMWRTMQLITAGYLVAGLTVPFAWTRAGIACRGAALLALTLLFTVLDPTQLPVCATMDGREPETVMKTWEEPDGTVAVMQRQSGGRVIRINSGYTLGSSDAYVGQVNQTRIPLYIYPRTERIFFLGLGTGITAGAALAPEFENVKQIVACELSPAVVEAARTYMPEELTGGIFSDSRSTVLVEDGRHYLRVSDDSFDMINADLFLPHRRGAGSLYSLDHYRTAAARLSPNGVFVQWVPLFQVTEHEFGIIVRTMLEAFGQVNMWRKNFTPGHEQVALIGQRAEAPIEPPPALDVGAMRSALAELNWQDAIPEQALPHPSTILYYYCGNLTAARELFEHYPINTDDRPLIEYLTPRLFRDVAASEQIIWFVGPRFATLVEKVLTLCPPEQDPLLRKLPRSRLRLVAAGKAFHWAMIGKALGRTRESQAQWAAFRQAWLDAAEAQ